MMKKDKLQIGVIGDSKIRTDLQYEIAYEIGQEIARTDSILICGGRGGVMDAAAKGVYDANGISIGILPEGVEDKEISKYLTVKIPTYLQWGRNPIVVLAADGIIACGGNVGTLSELSFAALYNRPIVCITSFEVGGWSQEIGERGSLQNPSVPNQVLCAETGIEAVRKIKQAILSSK
ncbi:MAG: TIGR00725 family protein [Candidatus Hodarchaeales archaeon]|jgi:uncharacterized protein (TIGR00725 family)